MAQLINLHAPPALNTVKLKIPVSKIVRQFVLWHENLTGENPKPINANTTTAMLLSSLLVQADLFNAAKASAIVEEYDAFLSIEIETKIINQYGCYVPDYNIIYFNTFMRRQMDEFLLKRIIDRNSLGIDQQDTINDFIEDAGLESLTNYESLKKAVYRLETAKGLSTSKQRKRQLRYSVRRR
jgi:hypothetical protein